MPYARFELISRSERFISGTPSERSLDPNQSFRSPCDDGTITIMKRELETAVTPFVYPSGSASSMQNDREAYRSPLRYPGGKQKAIAAISNVLPQSAMEYREPLVGGGSVYFHARQSGLAKSYWINDAFKELISFWTIVQDQVSCDKLMKELEDLRSQFTSADQIKGYFLSARFEVPVEQYRQAFLFFFFNRVTFSGTTRAGGFSAAASTRRFTRSSIERLVLMPAALRGTRITNLDFAEVIAAEGEDVFIFLDPPYYTAARLYGHGGTLHVFDHEKLAKLLKTTEHKFLITYDDCKEIRRLYKWANLRKWRLQYGMNNCSLRRESKIGSELFISNY
jgi:DNA adenine methylase